MYKACFVILYTVAPSFIPAQERIKALLLLLFAASSTPKPNTRKEEEIVRGGLLLVARGRIPVVLHRLFLATAQYSLCLIYIRILFTLVALL
jgi:hypothetical protein